MVVVVGYMFVHGGMGSYRVGLNLSHDFDHDSGFVGFVGSGRGGFDRHSRYGLCV